MAAASWNPEGFECTNCGKCCSNFSDDQGVMLTRDDVLRLARNFGLTKSEFAQSHVDFVSYSTPDGPMVAMILKSQGPRCPYLDEKDHCSVHEVKPEQCARGPFGVYYPSAVSPDYECLEGLEVPQDWDTSVSDAELRARCLFSNQIELVKFLVDA